MDSGGWVSVDEDGGLEVFKEGVYPGMYVGLRLNSLSVFSMNANEMLSNALEKSICSMRPGRLFVLACWKRSKVFLVTSPMNRFGRYAFCHGEMILSRIGFSLAVRTPEVIL